MSVTSAAITVRWRQTRPPPREGDAARNYESAPVATLIFTYNSSSFVIARRAMDEKGRDKSAARYQSAVAIALKLESVLITALTTSGRVKFNYPDPHVGHIPRGLLISRARARNVYIRSAGERTIAMG